MEIYSFLSYSAAYAVILPLSIALLRFRYLNIEMKILTVLLCIGALTELAANILANLRINNLAILHVYAIVEFVLLFTIYYIFFKGLISKKWYLAIVFGFIAFALVNAFYIQNLQNFNTYPLLLESTMLTALAILFFYKTLQGKKVLHIEKMPMFWFSSGHLIFFAGNLSIFTFSNFVLAVSNQLHEAVWAIHSVLLIILYVTYSIALLCR